MKRGEILWHYTSGDNLQKILRAGVLRPAGAKRTPVVWFTYRRDWDPAAAVGGIGGAPSKKELEDFRAAGLAGGVNGALERYQRHRASGQGRIAARDLGGLARIGVAPATAPHTWADYVRGGGLQPTEAWAIETIDRTIGSDPGDWRISFEAVPASKWLAVEWRSGEKDGEKWQPVRTATDALLEALRSGLK